MYGLNISMPSTPHILIFDSGVGGLSVAKCIRSQHPGCSITYLSDNAAFPYGDKPEAELIARVNAIFQRTLWEYQPDMVVLACNTASTVTLPHLRQTFATPFIGVVPAIKPAAALSKTAHIALLATPATINRDYTHQLIAEYAHHCKISKLGSRTLVLAAEAKLRGETFDPNILPNALAELFDKPESTNIDTVVLACTHFPLLKDELQSCLSHHAIEFWVDSGEAIARRISHWLEKLTLETGDPSSVFNQLVLTQTIGDIDKLIDNLEPYLGQLSEDQVFVLPL